MLGPTAVLPADLRAKLTWREPERRELVSSGNAALDAQIGGLPRGAITEIVGNAGAGRTSFLHTCLATLTRQGESCAYLDPQDEFDPASAQAGGVELSRLLWLQGGGDVQKIWRAADLVLQSGGFGVVALDLGDVPGATLQRWPSSTWHRFRVAVEKSPTVLLVVGRQRVAQSCAALRLQVEREEVRWAGRAPEYPVLHQFRYSLTPEKPQQGEKAVGHSRVGE